jgi:hypothetical protein
MRETLAARKAIDESREVHKAIQTSLEKLKDAPDDPEANLKVGRYHCFLRNEWTAGLPLLVKGSDKALAELAALDLANPQEAAEQLQVGDKWHEMAQKGPINERAALEGRAFKWYQSASPNLTGLVKSKVDKRLEEMEKSGLKLPASAKAPPMKVCDSVAAKRQPTGVAPGVVAFSDWNGNGRRGGNGLLVAAPTGWAKRGTVWNCRYMRARSARGVHFIHPLGQGHVVVTINAENKLFVNTVPTFPDGEMLNPAGFPLEFSKEYDQLVRNDQDVMHQLTSVVSADGKFQLYFEGKLVARGIIPRSGPISILNSLKIEKPFSPLPAGMGGIAVGPCDGGTNIADQVYFGALTDPSNPVYKAPAESLPK